MYILAKIPRGMPKNGVVMALARIIEITNTVMLYVFISKFRNSLYLFFIKTFTLLLSSLLNNSLNFKVVPPYEVGVYH
jgi:hypothetical protein